MSEEAVPYRTGKEDDEDGSINLGKHWGAISNGAVVGVVSMRVPSSVDFEEYRTIISEALALLGEVKSGEVIERAGQRYFVQRLNHKNRSKKPRTPKEYLIYQPHHE